MQTVRIKGQDYAVKPPEAVTKIAHFLSAERFQHIPIKSPAEIAKLKAAGQICANILDEISPYVKVGVTRKELNTRLYQLIRDKYHAEVDRLVGDAETDAGNRISACFGHNHIIVNAEPNDEQLMPGDIFGIDISVKKDGWCGDTRKTWLIGEEASPTVLSLFAVSHRAMWLAISMVKAGVRIADIAAAVERYVQHNGFAMIKLPITSGHSLGQAHMDGWLIPLFNSPINAGRVLEAGMVITIEPFISAGSGEAYLLDNELGSAITAYGAPACYWEHAVVVTPTGCEILDLRAEEKADWGL